MPIWRAASRIVAVAAAVVARPSIVIRTRSDEVVSIIVFLCCGKGQLVACRLVRHLHVSRCDDSRLAHNCFAGTDAPAGAAAGTLPVVDPVGRLPLALDGLDPADILALLAADAQGRVDPQADQVAADAGGTFLVVDVRLELGAEVLQRRKHRVRRRGCPARRARPT